MNVQQHIAFSCNGFPIASETFVTKQIHSAWQANYRVSVHCVYVNYLEHSSIEQEFVKELLATSVFHLGEWPEKYLWRLGKALNTSINSSSIVPLVKSLNYFKYGKNGINLRVFKNASTFLFSDGPDLVHAHFGPNGVRAVHAREIGIIDCPIITTFHGYDAHYADENKKNQLKRTYRRLFASADAIVVNGAYLKSQIEGLGCPVDKIRIVENGVNCNFFRPVERNYGNREMKLITVGRLLNWKNQKLGIETLKYLRERGINASYSIIGNGPELDALKGISKTLKVENYVHFHGVCDQEVIRKALADADIFLMTSVPGPDGRKETQGIVTLEAQASGLPVVAIRNGGIGNTVDDKITGVLVDPGDTNGYLEATLDLASDAVKRQKYGRNAVEFVRGRFNDKDKSRQLRDLYQELIVRYSCQ